MRYRIHLSGHGHVEVAAYGTADAEHLVGKEILRAWPDARVEVLQISRPEGHARIAEEFTVRYRVYAVVQRSAATPTAAERDAFRAARERFRNTRYRGTEWEPARVEGKSAEEPQHGD